MLLVALVLLLVLGTAFFFFFFFLFFFCRKSRKQLGRTKIENCIHRLKMHFFIFFASVRGGLAHQPA